MGERYRLISGHHRLTAYGGLGHTRIPAIVVEGISDDAARLEEVMENLGRAELWALDRCHHLYELKQVWERMYPETKNGGNFGNQYTKSKKALISARRHKMPTPKINSEDMPIVFGFARAVADKVGLDQRTIRQAVMIWTRLAPAVRLRLRGTGLATKQTELLALSDLKAPVQMQVLELILGPQRGVDNVAAAVAFLAGRLSANDYERRLLRANVAFGKLKDEVFEHVIVAHEARIIASLTRRGRI